MLVVLSGSSESEKYLFSSRQVEPERFKSMPAVLFGSSESEECLFLSRQVELERFTSIVC